jgi:hypothetical protein
MKNSPKNRKIAITCLFILVYLLAILINKRISNRTGFDFILWSPYFLGISILIPLTLILPIKFLPSSWYTTFINRQEKLIKTIIIVTAAILLIWLLFWHGMLKVGSLIDNGYNGNEADSVAAVTIKNDSLVKANIGLVGNFELTTESISTKIATYEYILHVKDTSLRVTLFLTHEQKWTFDRIIKK